MPQSIPFEDQYWENKREEYDKYFWGDDEDDSSDFFEEFEELAKADAEDWFEDELKGKKS